MEWQTVEMLVEVKASSAKRTADVSKLVVWIGRISEGMFGRVPLLGQANASDERAPHVDN